MNQTEQAKLALLLLLKIKSYKKSDKPIFKLASGKMSDVYVDCKPTILNGAGMVLIATLINAKLRECTFSAIGGPELGAVPIAVASSVFMFTEKKASVFIVRKEKKDHGTEKIIEGDVKPEDRVVIVEDVVTTGGSTITAIEKAKQFGLDVVKVIVFLDRQEGGLEKIKEIVPDTEAIFTLDDLNNSKLHSET